MEAEEVELDEVAVDEDEDPPPSLELPEVDDEVDDEADDDEPPRLSVL